jgi:2-octaprenylphenol hydroxylase
MKKPDYDITIIGAGIVGLTLACALANSGLRIVIVDQKEINTDDNDQDYDLRVSAITLASQKIWEKFGVWQKILTHRVSQFQKMHVWDADNSGVLNFNCADIGESALGYIIENRVIIAALYERAKTFSNIDFIQPATLYSMLQNENDIHLQLSGERFLSTKLLVGADGAKSRVRELSPIELHEADYGHTALVATVKTECPHENTAWQRFSFHRILAFLPLTDSYYCSIVWSLPSEEADRLLNQNETDFKIELANAFENKLGRIEKISQRVIFPLRKQHAKKYVLDKVALVGDCAHTIHPLAGQGVNLGILDAAALAEVILTAHSKNRRIGSHATLRRYERWRKNENMLMLSFVGMIKHLFSREDFIFPTLREFSLNFTNKTIPLKKFFMRRAAGLRS